jgi:polysaccharide pyruvyl transferase CsaB
MHPAPEGTVHVLISGYYGFGNLGDEALLAGLIATLQPSGHRITALSHDPEATRSAHGVAARQRLRGLPAALLSCDVLLSGGGGLLQDRTSARSLGYYLGTIRMARSLGRRVVLFGQSIGPLSPAGEHRVARTLRGLQVSVRDTPSQALLARLGIEAHLGADAALLLPPAAAPADLGAAPTLLIPRRGYPWITEALADTALRLGGLGLPCAALALHPDEDDGELAALLRAAPAVERLHADDVAAARAHIVAARTVLSGRLHGLILAAHAGRPHAGLVYDPKVAGFLADSGAPGFGPPAGENPADPERLAQLALAAEAPTPGRMATLRRRATEATTWLERAIVS